MTDQAVLCADALRLTPDSTPITEPFQRGEVVGLAGLEGHGQARFLATLAGVHRPISGQVLRLDQGTQTLISGPNAARAAGIGYMPPDRKRYGIFPGLGVEKNFLLGNTSKLARLGWLRKRRGREQFNQFSAELSIVCDSPSKPIESLSGGNQQKVLLARAMASSPDVLLLDDPTRGVDIGTRHAIFSYFRKAAADSGTLFVVLSSEIEEITQYCDRALVFHNKTLSARLPRKQLTEAALMDAMFGQTNQGAAR